MRGEHQLLRIGEDLVRLACRSLPPDIRQERYQEWAAELPAILHDPQIGTAPRRAVRMLAYAADTLRGTTMTATRRQAFRSTTEFYLMVVVGLAALAGTSWAIVQAPGHGPDYLQLAWILLLLAWPVSNIVRPAKRSNTLIRIVAILLAISTFAWNAALAPGDWVNYFLAAVLILVLLIAVLARWITNRSSRFRRAECRVSAVKPGR
jgi:hypothetical protein